MSFRCHSIAPMGLSSRYYVRIRVLVRVIDHNIVSRTQYKRTRARGINSVTLVSLEQEHR
jgi:hypothetical protein